MRPKVPAEWELWACAQETIRQHGLDAPIHAAMRADELMAMADLDGAATWRLILHRVNDMLRGAEGEPH